MAAQRRNWCKERLRPLAAAVLGVSTIALAGEAMAKTYTLSISGDPGASYSGTCTVTVASGSETIELDGSPPLERTFEGEGLSCALQAEGRIVAEIEHDGSRSRGESTGGAIEVHAS
ncbi:MAG: hypothetical protein AAF637_20510 [Pseudomonadota bacterium]